MEVKKKAVVVPQGELNRWDLKNAWAARFRLGKPEYVPLGNILQAAGQSVRPTEEPDTEFYVYGVNNKDGVYYSHTQLGKDFNSNYIRIMRDDFFHNPTRANVGSVGRVPKVPENAVTSPEYQVWKCRDGISPDYVEAMTKTKTFLDLVDIHRVGAVKQRLFRANLFEIPAPKYDAETPTRVKGLYQAAVRRAGTLIGRENGVEEAAEARILSALGVENRVEVKAPKGFSVGSDVMERWSVRFHRNRWDLKTLLKGAPVSRTVGALCWLNPAGMVTDSDDPVTFVPMDAVSAQVGQITAIQRRPVNEVRTGFTRFQKGDLIWAKITPCMENGKSALTDCIPTSQGYGSTEFHVIRIKDPLKLSSRYLWAILRLSVVRIAAESFFTGSAGQQRVPEDFLRRLHIPCPDINTQESIANLYESALNLRERIREKREEEWRTRMGEIDKEIFG